MPPTTTMQALVFDAATNALEVRRVPLPDPVPGEALVRVLRAQVCSTDIEITRGYVPGYCGTLGHEFVGRIERLGAAAAGDAADAATANVVADAAAAALALGDRVVCEINFNDCNYTCADAVFARNHAPGRSVLGIIARDGCLAEYVCVPARNLHRVPPAVADAEAAFAEPLAAALRIVEQGIVDVSGPADGSAAGDVLRSLAAAGGTRRPTPSQSIAVLGDGKLGLLVAQVLALAAPGRVTLFGRHSEKMGLVRGDLAARVVEADAAASPPPLPLERRFDVVVEATGSEHGIRRALSLVRPMGAVVLKSTVSREGAALTWAEVCSEAVVQELALVGSRCGPMDAAVELLAASEECRALARDMVSAEFPLERGAEAMAKAKEKGVLKVAVVMMREGAATA
jgi:threonine dehydrogenase-like Zn-dependent dehydrogenase